MTEKEFNDLLYYFEGKVKINKIIKSEDNWFALGELLNNNTKEDLLDNFSKFPINIDITEQDSTVWIKVKDTPIVLKQKTFLAIPRINICLFFLTLLTTLMAGTLMEGGNPISLSDIRLGFPFSATLLLILGCHEFGHYYYGKKNNVDVTLPYFIPAPTFIGTLGAVIRIKSPIPHRKALLEIGASGPIAGFIVAVPILFIGLHLSNIVEKAPGGSIILGESLIMKMATFLVFPGLGETQDIMLHSVAFAAWIGLLVTMLNLLPIGQLDGGHIAYAILGKDHDKLAKWTFLMLIPLSFFSFNWLLWGGLILLLMRTVKHPPILDMSEKLSRKQEIIGIVSLLIFILCFMPRPFG
tara:strand:+ start:5339 stop:6400 length:1062 start_codon:yes stop_codon:yes gene_type:complete